MTDKLAKLPPDQLRHLVSRTAHYAKRKYADSTMRSHETQWRPFVRWCELHQLPSLPTTPEVVAMYLAALADGTVATEYKTRWGETKVILAPKKASYIEHVYSTIVWHQRDAGHGWHYGHDGLREVLRGIRRQLGTATKKASPLELSALKEGFIRYVRRPPEAELRDKLILSLGFFGAFRRSELVALEIDDLDFRDQGMIVRVKSSKQDPLGHGEEVAIPYQKDAAICPVRLARQYLDHLKGEAYITRGPIFRRMDRFGNQGNRMLSDSWVSTLVKEFVDRCGIDPSRFSGHSLRSGFATTAASKGKSLKNIMRQGRWRTDKQALSYIRPATLFTDNAADFDDDEPEG